MAFTLSLAIICSELSIQLFSTGLWKSDAGLENHLSKCLPCKQEDFSLIPRTHHTMKSQVWWAHLQSQQWGGGEKTEPCLVHLGYLANGRAVNDCRANKRCLRSNIWQSSGLHTHTKAWAQARTHTCTCAFWHTHTHTRVFDRVLFCSQAT